LQTLSRPIRPVIPNTNPGGTRNDSRLELHGSGLAGRPRTDLRFWFRHMDWLFCAADANAGRAQFRIAGRNGVGNPFQIAFVVFIRHTHFLEWCRLCRARGFRNRFFPLRVSPHSNSNNPCQHDGVALRTHQPPVNPLWAGGCIIFASTTRACGYHPMVRRAATAPPSQKHL